MKGCVWDWEQVLALLQALFGEVIKEKKQETGKSDVCVSFLEKKLIVKDWINTSEMKLNHAKEYLEL